MERRQLISRRVKPRGSPQGRPMVQKTKTGVVPNRRPKLKKTPPPPAKIVKHKLSVPKQNLPSVKKDRILIVSPFKNESRAIPLYLEGLKAISYPHNLIDVVMIVNDSSDASYDLLMKAKPTLDFRSVEIMNIILTRKCQQSAKNVYFKEYTRSKDDVVDARKQRVVAWISMWNDYIFPRMESSECAFMLMIMGDCVPPANVIEEYLKVYELKDDAGWVGGILHRRHPLEKNLCSPALPKKDYTQGIKNFGIPKGISKAVWTGHCWMMPTRKLVGLRCNGDYTYDVHLSIIDKMRKMNLSVYCQPSVYIKHISADGKIYRHGV